MFRQFKLDLKLYKARLLFWPAFVLLGFVLGGGLMFLIAFADETVETVFYAGTLAGLGMAALFGGIVQGILYPMDLTVALSMGRTRREIIGSFVLRQLLGVAISYVMLLVLYPLEMALYGAVMPGYASEFQLDFLMDWRLVLLVALVEVVLPLFIGVLMGRFGKKAALVLYFLWIGLCIGLPRLSHAPAVTAFVAAIPTGVWIGLGAAAVVGMAAAIAILSRKQTVR